MRYAIHFKNPVFKMGGVQTTARLGAEWHVLNPGDTLNLKATVPDGNTRESIGRAYVNGVLYERLDRLPEWVFKREHDPEARTKEDLKSVLREIHRNEVLPGEINDKSCVTVVFFYVTRLEDDYFE